MGSYTKLVVRNIWTFRGVSQTLDEGQESADKLACYISLVPIEWHQMSCQAVSASQEVCLLGPWKVQSLLKHIKRYTKLNNGVACNLTLSRTLSAVRQDLHDGEVYASYSLLFLPLQWRLGLGSILSSVLLPRMS